MTKATVMAARVAEDRFRRAVWVDGVRNNTQIGVANRSAARVYPRA